MAEKEELHIYKDFRKRLWTIAILLLFPIGILLYFLWDLQIKSSFAFAETAQRRIARNIRISPIRGKIFSSNGTVLADNKPYFNLTFLVNEMRRGGRKKTIDFIINQAYDTGILLNRKHLPFSKPENAIIELDKTVSFEEFKNNNKEVYANIYSLIEYHLYYYPLMPLPIYYNLSKYEISLLEEQIPAIIGASIQLEHKRIYPQNSLAAHIIGYSSSSLSFNDNAFYHYAYLNPEIIGRNGIELFYNNTLSGKPGVAQIVVDSLGYKQEQKKGSIEAVHGNDIILTINTEIQAKLEELLKGKKGAAVIVDVSSGEVVAMASAPTYSLTDIISGSYNTINKDTDQPLLDRSVGAFTPGSIIKPLGLLAALHYHRVDADDLNNCEGFSPIGNTKIRCANRYGHGDLNLYDALACSCNDYMIDLILKKGMLFEEFQQFYKLAGVGTRPKIDLPYASSGILPSKEYILKHNNRKWTLFDSALITLGQGAIAISPLHGAIYTAALANGGTVYRPFLCKQIQDKDGNIIIKNSPIVENVFPVSKLNLDLIHEGMCRTITWSHGSAHKIQNAHVNIAGKTGTAEIGSRKNRKKNGWFIGYAPAEEPKYAICVLIENSVGGGTDAAPIAGTIFRFIFNNYNKSRNNKEE